MHDNAPSQIKHIFAHATLGTRGCWEGSARQKLAPVISSTAHTAIALIVPWACRAVPWLFWPMCIANLGVLVSIPSEGGHYLADMVAGAIITVAILFWLQWHALANPCVKAFRMRSI